MVGWMLPAIFAFLFWGLWGLFPKLAAPYLDPWSIFIYATIGNVAVALSLIAWPGFRPATDPKGIFIAFLGGLAGSFGSILYNVAASKGRISVVVTLTGLYPLVTIFLSFFLLHESLGMKDIAAMGLALSAIALISL